MYSKTSFTYTAYYHLLVGAYLIFVGTSTLFMAPLTGGILLVFLIFSLIGAGVAYAGYKTRTAERKAVIGLVVFNALQLFMFDLGFANYKALLGPYIHFDFLSAELSFGLGADLGAGFATGGQHTAQFFNLSFVPLVFIVYLLDQLSYIPRTRHQPWETEFAQDTVQ